MRGPRGGKCGCRSEVRIAGPWDQHTAHLGQRLSLGWVGHQADNKEVAWPRAAIPTGESLEGWQGDAMGPLLCLHRLAHSPGGRGKIHGLKNQFGFHGQPGRRLSPPDKGVGSPQGGGRPEAETLWPTMMPGKGGSRDVWGQRPEGGAPAFWP